MKRKSSVLLMTLLISANFAFGQESLGARPKKARTEHDYKPRTLREVINEGSQFEGRSKQEASTILDGHILPSRVRVTYTGSMRPLPQVKKELLRQWALRYAGFPEFYTVPYEKEMLFVENGANYWLAVRKAALPGLEQKFKQGEKLDLFLIRMGAAKTSDGWESLLLVESFQKPKQSI